MTFMFLVSVVERKMSSMSKPLILGIITSLTISCGRSLMAMAKASSPSLAETMS
jgi:glycopeptide antibiotics resistance protein